MSQQTTWLKHLYDTTIAYLTEWEKSVMSHITGLKPTCDVTALYFTLTHLWCHSCSPDRNTFVMSQLPARWKRFIYGLLDFQLLIWCHWGASHAVPLYSCTGGTYGMSIPGWECMFISNRVVNIFSSELPPSTENDGFFPTSATSQEASVHITQ